MYRKCTKIKCESVEKLKCYCCKKLQAMCARDLLEDSELLKSQKVLQKRWKNGNSPMMVELNRNQSDEIVF